MTININLFGIQISLFVDTYMDELGYYADCGLLNTTSNIESYFLSHK